MMIRIFNHYVHRSALQGMAFDLAVVLLVAVVAVGMQVHSVEQAVPLAGTQVVSFAACFFVISSASGLYELSSSASFGRAAARALMVLVVALPATYVIFGLLRRAYLGHTAARNGIRSRILIFGAGSPALVVANTIRAADPNIQIVGFLPGPNERDTAVPGSELILPRGTLHEMAQELGVDEIVVALTERRAGSMPMRQLLDCKVSGVKVYDLATHFEKTLGQIRLDYLNASWLIFGDGFNQGAWRTAVKRAFDIVSASVLLTVSAPLMLVTAILIKAESKGPVLYRQERVGQNGRSFSIAKFRSMRTDAEGDGKPRWATLNDDRVTRMGHIIRRLRIDELPQLFNVLRGDMSLVGPRPERPFFVEQLTQDIPFYALRHSVKPGVTGWAQVRYAYGATVEDSQEKLQFDLYYVKNHTLFLDIVVLFETVGVVLTGRGAR